MKLLKLLQFCAVFFVAHCQEHSLCGKGNKNCTTACIQVYQPVCGKSDDEYKEFGNSCLLGVYNCRNEEKYTAVDKQFCEQSFCLDLNEPLCATNGQRYIRFKSKCELKAYNCRFKRNFQQVPDINQCVSASDPGTDSCRNDCTDEYKPVCGQKGMQYYLFGNLCELRVHNCRYNDKFEPIKDIRKCHCPAYVCTKEYAPICASNGVTAKIYDNLCNLRSANCNFKDGILPVHDKFCDPDGQNKCPTDKNLCAGQYYPVCTLSTALSSWNRYRIFDNPCKVQVENCVTQNDGNEVLIVDIQHCADILPASKCDLLICNDYHYDPVCGENNRGKKKWFSNECVLDYYNCQIVGKGETYQKTDNQFCDN